MICPHLITFAAHLARCPHGVRPDHRLGACLCPALVHYPLQVGERCTQKHRILHPSDRASLGLDECPDWITCRCGCQSVTHLLSWPSACQSLLLSRFAAGPSFEWRYFSCEDTSYWFLNIGVLDVSDCADTGPACTLDTCATTPPLCALLCPRLPAWAVAMASCDGTPGDEWGCTCCEPPRCELVGPFAVLNIWCVNPAQWWLELVGLSLTGTELPVELPDQYLCTFDPVGVPMWTCTRARFVRCSITDILLSAPVCEHAFPFTTPEIVEVCRG